MQEHGAAARSHNSHGLDAGVVKCIAVRVVMHSSGEVVMHYGGGLDIDDPTIAHGGHARPDLMGVGSNPGATCLWAVPIVLFVCVVLVVIVVIVRPFGETF